jgi:hypothetical protein
MAALQAVDLITEALEEIGAIAAGDPLTTVDGAKGLAVLNRMILSSNNSRGAIVSERVDTYTLQTGVQNYTIGVDPAGILTSTFTGPRPLGLSRVNLLMPSGGNTVRRKINILTTAQWSAKTLTSVTGLPIEIYNDGGNPQSTWSFYQIPDRAWQIEAYTWQQFAALAALTTAIQAPPGCYEFWLYGLALLLCALFGRTAAATTIALYQEAKTNYESMNAESPRIASDGDHASGAGLYNWLSGTSGEDY